jgi:hypothetical protein
MRYLLFHCLDETAEPSPDDDSDAEGSAGRERSRLGTPRWKQPA